MSSQRIFSSFSFLSVLFSIMLTSSILIKDPMAPIIRAYMNFPRKAKWPSYGDPFPDNCSTPTSSFKTWSWLNIWCFITQVSSYGHSTKVLGVPIQDSSNKRDGLSRALLTQLTTDDISIKKLRRTSIML